MLTENLFWGKLVTKVKHKNVFGIQLIASNQGIFPSLGPTESPAVVLDTPTESNSVYINMILK